MCSCRQTAQSWGHFSTSAYHVPSFSCVQQYPAANIEQRIGTVLTDTRRVHSTQGLVMLYNANRKVDLAYATQEPPAGRSTRRRRGFASNLNLGELAQRLRASLCPWRIILLVTILWGLALRHGRLKTWAWIFGADKAAVISPIIRGLNHIYIML